MNKKYREILDILSKIGNKAASTRIPQSHEEIKQMIEQFTKIQGITPFGNFESSSAMKVLLEIVGK